MHSLICAVVIVIKRPVTQPKNGKSYMSQLFFFNCSVFNLPVTYLVENISCVLY